MDAHEAATRSMLFESIDMMNTCAPLPWASRHCEVKSGVASETDELATTFSPICDASPGQTFAASVQYCASMHVMSATLVLPSGTVTCATPRNETSVSTNPLSACGK